MATVVLSAAGHAVGSVLGGQFLGLSSAVLGRAVGASVGRSIDARIAGSGSGVVAGDSAARFRVQGAGEGQSLRRVYGRARIAGHVFWASRFLHQTNSSGSGKGTRSVGDETTTSYSVSLAIGLCEGEISGVGRIWADGRELSKSDLDVRVYYGSVDQQPDPKMEAVEGAGNVPAYRGLAYVVLEDLALGQFGNRVPQFSFEVTRPEPEDSDFGHLDLGRSVRAVAMIPGTGEYALATTPVHYDKGIGQKVSANRHGPGGQTDFSVSLEALDGELTNCSSVSLVVSWFADDLRCSALTLRPKVEQTEHDGAEMPWVVAGLTRDVAEVVPEEGGSVVYGGTPTDQSVVEAIQSITTLGKQAVFYPFILMDQLSGNTLTDPWSGAAGQPALPWRGRITTSLAPGVAGSPDATAAAQAEVETFFGQAAVSDFSWDGQQVVYSGPQEWSYRRMILHYAHLCAAAGGVDAFCIGSEMRSLTQIRGAGGSFPAVDHFCSLLEDVRAILGPSVKLGYAADWSEYFGYHPQDGSGDVYFHLDKLWAHPDLDFVGIDNYMPISDWRDGDDHADAGWGNIYDLDYLKSNIEGGEGYDWYYASSAAAESQIRTPIVDGAYGEDWVYRYKDIRQWWSNYHYDRAGGVRSAVQTDWEPMAKPIWFTEFGCAAIDKGANEPNKFLDPKSSESSLPKYSDGRRDDLMLLHYVAAVQGYWSDPANNPISPVYSGEMVDTSRMYVWAWDARPYPLFPTRVETWTDYENYYRGHWLNGRSTSRPLAGVVSEICAAHGVADVDVSSVRGIVRGYSSEGEASARGALQPLMLSFGVDARQKDGKLSFYMREDWRRVQVAQSRIADASGGLELSRREPGEAFSGVSLEFVACDADFELAVEASVSGENGSLANSGASFPLMLTRSEAKGITARWMAEAQIGQTGAKLELPHSYADVSIGDVLVLGDQDAEASYRVDRLVFSDSLEVEATRVEIGAYRPVEFVDLPAKSHGYLPLLPVSSLFLDLPLIRGDEVVHAPHVAVVSEPWQGSVAIFDAASGAGFALNRFVDQGAIVGVTQTALEASETAVWDRGPALEIKLVSGQLESRQLFDVLGGANTVAIGDGTSENWEVFQFADAQLVAEGTYAVSNRIRGLFGTEVSADWPVGSYVVLLDDAVGQLNLPMSSRGLDRNYLVGPARRPYSDPSYTLHALAFNGVGMRPLAPVHLSATAQADGSVSLDWVRRTRIDGDNWASMNVPLGEESELYHLEFRSNGQVFREATCTQQGFVYSQAMQVSDAVSGNVEISVAQVSASFGPGKYQRIIINV